MKASCCQSVLPYVLLVAAIIPIQSGCEEHQVTSKEATPNESAAQKKPVAWDSLGMLEIGKEWDSLWDIYCNEPDKISLNKRDTYRQLVRMQGDLLRTRLSNDDVCRLAATCGSLPVHCREWSKFENAVMEFMVEVCAYSRDRESLVTLLSTRFPLRVGNWPIECYLAVRARLNDPILILGEAYSKCRVPEVRHDIAAAVRRAFGGLGIPGKDDAEFVASAMRWYEKEREHLTVDIGDNSSGYIDPMLPLEPEEASRGQYEQIWSHRHSLFVRTQNREQSGNGMNESDQPKLEALSGSANGTPPERKSSGQAEDELAKLDGVWEIIECTSRRGAQVPRAKLKGRRFVFRKGQLEWIGPDGKKDHQFRIRLESDGQPSAMDLIQTPKYARKKEQTTPLVYEFRDERTAAIYELKGDTLRMCLPLLAAWQRPTSFKPEKYSAETSYTLRRVKE